MKVLYIVHHSFLNEPGNVSWLMKLQSQLESLGFAVSFFDMESDKLSDFPIVHIFGFGHFEISYLLRNKGKKIICTPGLGQAQPRSMLAYLTQIALTIFHSLKQRKLAPINIFHMIRSPNIFIVNQSTSSSWRKNWNLKNLSEVDFESKKLSKSLADIYGQMSKNEVPM